MAATVVYLVDDDPLAIKNLASALRDETGYQVATFATAEDLWAAVDKRAPAAVVADYKMPGTDGLAAIERVQARHPEVVGIVMATYGDERSMRVLLDALGPLRVVNKPTDLPDLLLKIRAGLERRALLRELRTMRAELDRANARLASTEREAKTATERLVEAEQLAAVGRVVSGIAHELTDQLALVGYAEAIKARVGGDSEVAEFADVIVTAQKRLSQMVEEIRDFVATERDGDSGKMLAREPSDVAGVVDEALTIMRYDRDVRDRHIERAFRARPLAALDRNKFSQVIINLVSNAALATAAGDAITVELDTDDNRGQAVIAVVDRGCGMPPDVLARLGEPFFSARDDRGSGLGVGICKRIVEDHGGSLDFESAVGQGTRATVRIPLLEDAG